MSEQLVTIGDQTLTVELEEGDMIADVFLVARVLNINDRLERIMVSLGDSTSRVTGVGILRLAHRQVEDDALGYYYDEDDE